MCNVHNKNRTEQPLVGSVGPLKDRGGITWNMEKDDTKNAKTQKNKKNILNVMHWGQVNKKVNKIWFCCFKEMLVLRFVIHRQKKT